MATVSRGNTTERYQFIERNRQLGITYLCDWLNVSRSGYYDWRKREVSQRLLTDQVLSSEIRQIHEKSKGVYGSPRIYHVLKTRGYAIGKKRVERLMREEGLRGRVVTVTRRQPGLKRFKAKGENLRRVEPDPQGLNEVWVGDITYLKIKRKWCYLATVMDVYSRRIIGWSLSQTRTVDLTIAAMRNAMKERKIKSGLIFHTDRGIEYTASKFQAELERQGIRHSVNRPGYCTDNAHMESFFHSMKAELIRGNQFQYEDELRYALKNYINRFYNHQRLHSGIGYMPPAEYEKLVA